MQKLLDELSALKKLVNKYGVTLQEIRTYVGERLSWASREHLKQIEEGTKNETEKQTD